MIDGNLAVGLDQQPAEFVKKCVAAAVLGAAGDGLAKFLGPPTIYFARASYVEIHLGILSAKNEASTLRECSRSGNSKSVGENL
jgi:hypothetical protein